MSSELPETSSTAFSSTSPKEKTNQALREILEQENGNKAVEILNIIAYFASENIHCGMFSEIMSDEELKGAIKLLKEYSLVTLDAKENVVCITKFVQKVIKDTMEEQRKEEVLKQALHMLSKEINSDTVDHALSVWSYASEYPNLIKELGRLSSQVVNELKEQNRYKEGDMFGWKALNMLKKTVGEHHLETLVLQRVIGELLGGQGQYMKALEILRHLLELKEILEQNELLKVKILVAKYLTKTSQYNEALSLYKNIFGNKKVSETRDKPLFYAWKDYAHLQNSLENYEEAIEILRETIEKGVEIFGLDDDTFLEFKTDLAYFFKQQSKFSEALALFREVYDKKKDVLGENHNKTLVSKRDIARIFQDQGKYEAALAMLQEGAKNLEQVVGKKHPDTLLYQCNIATIFQLRKENDKALKIFEEVYQIQCETLGPKDDLIIVTQANIAAVLYDQGNSIKAAKFMKKAYQGFFENCGSNHETTLLIKNNLAGYESECNKITVAAIRDGNLNHIETLIQNGLDINKCDDNEGTPMHYAARHGQTHVVKFLLEKGAIYNIKNKEGKTPAQLSGIIEIRNLFNSVAKLFQCVKEEDEQGIRNVIKERTIINAKEVEGYTPLHWAAHNANYNIANILLDSGADVTQVTNKGNSFLHIAALKGSADIFELVLCSATREELVDLTNAKTIVGGNTPLHVASKNGNKRIVRELLRLGAIYDAKNADGKTPVDLAEEKSIKERLNLIKELFEDAECGNREMIMKVRVLDLSELSPVINARNEAGKTFQEVAIDFGHKDIADQLFIRVQVTF